jgi:RNA polymerase sigma factor (sigma-70 family)
MTKDEKVKVINQWLVDNYNQLQINVHKVCGHSPLAIQKWGDDIIPYVWETFRKMDLDKQYEIITNGNPENYLTRGMALSIKSSTSMFYHHYRKFSRKSNEFSTEYHDKELQLDWEQKDNNNTELEKAMKSLDFYDQYIVREYYFENKTVKTMAEITGIAASTLSKDIKKALKRLKIILEGKVDFT